MYENKICCQLSEKINEGFKVLSEAIKKIAGKNIETRKVLDSYSESINSELKIEKLKLETEAEEKITTKQVVSKENFKKFKDEILGSDIRQSTPAKGSKPDCHRTILELTRINENEDL